MKPETKVGAETLADPAAWGTTVSLTVCQALAATRLHRPPVAYFDPKHPDHATAQREAVEFLTFLAWIGGVADNTRNVSAAHARAATVPVPPGAPRH